MKPTSPIRWLLTLLLLLGTANVYSVEHHLKSCRAFYGRLSDLKVQRPPRRVLLIPLLSRDPHTNESPRWSEAPARQVRAFYRNRFHSAVKELRDIWSWSDYYEQVEPLIERSQTFDRVVFISHGGFDGPVLKNAVFSQNLEINGNQARLLQQSEAQPGLLNVLSITYDTHKNKEFSEFIQSRRDELRTMKPGEIWQRLTGLEKRITPLNQACFDRYCSPEKLATSPDGVRRYRLDLCELICREALFEQKTATEISPERFFHFANTLSSLTADNGLIFFGACNPGSSAPNKMVEHDDTELLIHSTLAGGPHQTYVHLVSNVTGRITTGPIGKSSAEDIVNRIMLFENNRSQRNLCIATPSAR
ncbi:MAG: hypothetical protein ACU841_16450 [Gammaproteobacteria bacterium]